MCVALSLQKPALALALGVVITPSSMAALTIERDFIGGTPQPVAIGSGNLVDIFNSAANEWERAIEDDHTVTLHYGWADVGGGQHTLEAQGGTPIRETEGTILFNNNTNPENFAWWLDPTPNQHEEYMSYNETFDDLGGGAINISREFSDGIGDAGVVVQDGYLYTDLRTSALHEIGHALGISVAGIAFQEESVDGDVDITSPRPFAGTTIPLATNNFGVTSHIEDRATPDPVMAGSDPGTRSLLSEADILVNAELSEFTDINLNPIPEPTTSLLVGLGLSLLALRR